MQVLHTPEVGWPTLQREHGFVPLEIDGTLPADLTGTLYRNGPARFEVGGVRMPHPFDGDGAITAVRLGHGQAQGALRFIAHPARAIEARLGRHLGGYGLRSAHPTWDLFRRRFRNVANTSVLPYQGELLALWEGGLPTAVDPETLDTHGETTLGGAIVESFSAHPHRHRSGDWFNFGVRIGRVNRLDLYHLPRRGAPRRIRTETIAPGMVHDFALTEHHAVFFLSPLVLSVFDLAWGRRAFGDALDWRPELGTEVLVLPLDGGPARRFRTEAFYQWHFANAFEDGEDLVVDFVRYPDFETNEGIRAQYEGRPGPVASGRPCRARIRGTQLETETVADLSAEFCTVRPDREGTPEPVVFMAAHSDDEAARGPLNQVARIDVGTGEVRRRGFGPSVTTLEPLFAATDTGGWLLVPLDEHDAGRGSIAILDPDTLDEVARCRFGQRVPVSFHGRWVGV